MTETWVSWALGGLGALAFVVSFLSPRERVAWFAVGLGLIALGVGLEAWNDAQ